MDKLRIGDASPDLSFPFRLFLMLRDADDEFPDAIQWAPSSNGRVFEVKDPDRLEKTVLPLYFKTSIKYTSFRRQLLGYGFECIGKRQYTHKLFSRDDPQACERLDRVKSKPKKNKAMSNRIMLTNVLQLLTPTWDVPVPVEDRDKDQCCERDYTQHSPQNSVTPQDLTPISICSDPEEEGDDLDFEISRLFPSSGSLKIPPTTVSPVAICQEDSMAAIEPQEAPSELNPLQVLWTNYVSSMKAELEPRNIHEMIATPNRWYDLTPSMTPHQQAVIELFLPVTLPGAFYYLNMSQVAMMCGYVFVVAHTIECMYTNFGSGPMYKGVMGPLQHIVGDTLMNHLMSTTFLLLGPSVFGDHCAPLTLGLILLNVSTMIMNYKIHFEAFILKPLLTKGGLTTESTAVRILQYKFGRHVRRTLSCYAVAWILLAAAFGLAGDAVAGVMAVLVYNLVPFVSDMSYWLEFSKHLLLYPKRDRTVLSDRHLSFLVKSECKSKVH